MKRIIFSLFALLAVLTSFAQVENPVTWNVKATGDKITMTATINEPWHMYDLGPYKDGPNATTVTFTLPDGVTLNGTVKQITKPKRVQDEIFKMEIGYFAKSAVLEQTFYNSTGKPATVKGTIEWQVCDDQSCLPPTEYDFEVKVGPSKPIDMQAPVTVGEDPDLKVDEAMTVTPESDQVTDSTTTATISTEVADSQIKEEQKSMWAIILEAILWGFAALLTPCVFPMVPMTVSFFMKSSGSKTRGRFLAFFYGISIVALYTLPIAAIIMITFFAGGESVTADIFNWLATHWVPNIFFFLIFMVFAASFFGAFEITMPSKLVNKTDAQSDKGGLFGIFFMAMTLVLVSFSCTGPIVGSVLVKSTQGEIWEPIVTMLAFSTAFALPFTIFAFFPSLLKNLPKSGGWLNSVKVVLGFIELALGLKFLSVADQTYHWNLLDREVYLALWIVIFSMLGLYLLGKIRFAHDDKTDHLSVKRLFFAICSFTFVVYMIPGMWGAPLNALSGYLPPMHTMDFNLSVAPKGSGGSAAGTTLDLSKIEGGKPKYSDFLHLPHGLEGFFNYDEGMEYARKVNKPVLLDFTGHGCVNCREMEANVWADPAVLSLMSRDYVIIALYVDDKKELPESQWITDSKGKVQKSIGKVNSAFQIAKFGINAQPYYVLINPFSDKMLAQPRSYNLDVAGFVKFLESGITAFKAQQK